MPFWIGDGGSGNQPQATNNNDLLDRLVNFLTSATSPIASAQRWTVLKDVNTDANTREVYLRGPGLAGSDQIYVNLRVLRDTTIFVYNIEVRGAFSFDTNLDFENQPNGSDPYYIPLLNSNMTYWFVGNGRRFVVVARTGNSYQHMYCGFYLPSATVTEFPYPLFIGAMSRERLAHPSISSYTLQAWYDSARSAGIMHRDNSWLTVSNNVPGANLRTNDSLPTKINPYANGLFDLKNQADSGDYALFPIWIDSTSNGGNHYGEVEGVCALSGTENTSESTGTIDSRNYIFFQNSARSNRLSFMALELS